MIKMDKSIGIFRQCFNLQNAEFSKIEHDDAMVAIVYRVTLPSGIQQILKICPRNQDYFRDEYFLSHFANVLPVPSIVDVLKPDFNTAGAILMTCLTGSLLRVENLNNQLAFEIGTQLAKIHLNRITGYGDIATSNSLNSESHLHYVEKFKESVAECIDCLPETLIKDHEDNLNANLGLFASVDGPCIIHRDFRPGNIIVDNGKLGGIIDWASARASFAEEDFCSFEHGEWGDDPDIKQNFLKGYSSIRPVPDYSAIMRLLRIGRAFATVGYILKNGTWNNIHFQLYKSNRQFLETAL
jgi:serine/threonine protein kinase